MEKDGFSSVNVKIHLKIKKIGKVETFLFLRGGGLWRQGGITADLATGGMRPSQILELLSQKAHVFSKGNPIVHKSPLWFLPLLFSPGVGRARALTAK